MAKKLTMKQIKKAPPSFLLRVIQKAKDHLKKDGVMQEIFKEHGVDIEEIDLIPTYFKDIEVSATTDHGIVYINYELLEDGFGLHDYSYLIHEYTHWIDQTAGDKPTQGADDGDYLHNPAEQKGFQNQLEYLANQFGKDEAENYLDDLLEYHEKDGDEKEELEEILSDKI